jgi:CBS domain-containing protein
MSEQSRAMKLKDRPEFSNKPKPLTTTPDTTVSTAVGQMAALNYGSIMVNDTAGKLVGIVTERDILRRVVNEGRDPNTTLVEDVMTRDPRVAQEDDDVTDWLRIMSNDRFRRLPVVDSEGRVQVVFTQGDFVSYTWPDLIYQATELAKASILDRFPILLIGGGIAIYTIIMALIFGSMS